MSDWTRPTWEQTPEAWDRASRGYAAELAPRTAAFAADLVRLLDAPHGARFLDVACGTGSVALCAARGGQSVVAIDFSAEMTGRLAHDAAREQLKIEVRQMDGQRLAFADRSFYAAASLFGLQFFADRAAGLRELRRVLVDGGRVAIGAWAEPGRVELMTPLLRALAAIVPDAPAPSGPPLLFSMSDPDRLAAEITAAGFGDVAMHEVDHPYVFADVDAFWRMLETAAPAAMERIAALPSDGRAAVRAALVDDLDSCFGAGPIALSATARIAIGRATH